MIIENKDNKSNPLRMRLITTFQTTVKQFFRDTFFHDRSCLLSCSHPPKAHSILISYNDPEKGMKTEGFFFFFLVEQMRY